MANTAAALEIDGVRHVYSGKVRDLYEYADDRLLVVASDRISAFDWILPTLIPDKGRVLTSLTAWWFEQLADAVPNHVASYNVPDAVVGRAMVVHRLDMFPIECVARGYLSGSGFNDYQLASSVCGIKLPSGLTDGSKLPQPIFTPATKADLGAHDENIDFDAVGSAIGVDDAESLRALTLGIYARASAIAADKGILVADTKLEFGRDPKSGAITLADEVLTPDSSRFWSADQWHPGGLQPSFDKQIVRDWLTSPASGWDQTSGQPPPALPNDVVERTRAKYIEVYERLTGKVWS